MSTRHLIDVQSRWSQPGIVGRMSAAIPAEARNAIDSYLAKLDEALPGVCDGIYLTGSIALGDWRPGRSDLDVLSVTTRKLVDADIEVLAGVHAGLAKRPCLDAIYIDFGEVGRVPVAGSAGLPHSTNAIFSPNGYFPDPVLWATLDRCGVTVRGKPAAELGAGPHPAWLREWNLGNFESYWRPWAAQGRAVLGKRDASAPSLSEGTAFGLLGPGRLHYTIATGGLLAKTDSADYTAHHFPAFAELLARAKAWRLGDDSVAFTAVDGLATFDLVETVADASAIFAAN
jgi:predicted nucleotidyltransferase